jgi:NAD(P)-dependent dehydrogenase (short-subunit alcohol dehydrogenase family)
VDHLEGKMAFITGGASGIGLAMARSFAGAGMTLALADIDANALEQANHELSQRTDVVTLELDVSDRQRYAAAADTAEERLGPIGVLCNNAATHIDLPISEMTYQAWDIQLNITLGGQINGIQTFLPRMLERNEPAHIVNTSSQAGLVASHGGRLYMYNMAKFAIVGLSEALRQVLEPTPIDITLLLPGYVATNFSANALKILETLPVNSDARRAAEERSRKLTSTQTEMGMPADEVGRMILDAVRTNKFYVHTARRAEEVAERTRAIIASMPPETDRDRQLEEYVNN